MAIMADVARLTHEDASVWGSIMVLKQSTFRREPSNPREGYTIIELMVTLIVLAVLAVLVLPSLRGVRSASRQIGCAIELKRIDDGLNRFADDNKSLYTIAGGLVPWREIDPKTHKPSWMEQVMPYLTDKSTLAGCAAYPLNSSYHYFLGARAATIEAEGQFAAVDREKIRFADSFVLTGDNNFSRFADQGPVADADKDDYSFMTQVFSESDSHWAPHHDGMLNTAFADGHVAVFDRFDPERMTYRYDTMSAY